MLACSSCRREAREQATLEKAERAIFLAALGHHLDALRARMGEDEWAAFAEQLYQRLRPAVTQDDLSIDVTVLRQLSDDIRELCLGWPGVVRATFEWLAARATEGAAGMAFPKRWREKQDLLSRFQHLERKLGKTRGEEGDLNGESKSGRKLTLPDDLSKEARLVSGLVRDLTKVQMPFF